MVFDAPKMKGPFKKRLERMHKVIDQIHKDDKEGVSRHVEVLDHQICQGYEHLMKELDRVTAKGGEGVMLRDPES